MVERGVSVTVKTPAVIDRPVYEGEAPAERLVAYLVRIEGLLVRVPAHDIWLQTTYAVCQCGHCPASEFVDGMRVVCWACKKPIKPSKAVRALCAVCATGGGLGPYT